MEQFSTKIIDLFLENYQPAATFAEADAWYSTAYIYQQLQDMHPETQYNTENLISDLENRGYRPAQIPGGEVAWILRKA